MINKNSIFFLLIVYFIAAFPGLAYNVERDTIKLSKYIDNNHYANLKIGEDSSIEFKLSENDNDPNNPNIIVTICNGKDNETWLLFKNKKSGKSLKNLKPRIIFSKTYGGDADNLYVEGSKVLKEDYIIIEPKSSKIIIDVPSKELKSLALHLYRAKYEPKAGWLLTGHPEQIKILNNDQFVINNIEIETWNETDPEYREMCQAVAAFKEKIKDKKFCPNPKHNPSLKKQKEEYALEKDRLYTQIDDILRKNGDWYSTDPPRIKYEALQQELVTINLDDMEKDCGKHSRSQAKPAKREHKCNYCNKSAKEIYQVLNDTYIKLYNGSINKGAALNTANGLYNCYKTRKDNSFNSKIEEYYKKIKQF